MKLFLFPKRIEFIRQIAERHADDGDDDVWNGWPPLEHFDEELQAEVVDENVAYSDKEIPDNLCPTAQGGTRKTNMASHPEAREESDGELEHEGRNVRREGNKTEVKDLTFENEMIENIVQHPFQNEVQATAGRVSEQFEAHHFAERRIEKVDDRSQSAFYPRFYVLQDWHSGRKNSNLEPNNFIIIEQFRGLFHIIREA